MKRHRWILFFLVTALMLPAAEALAQDAGNVTGKVVSVNTKQRTLVITGDKKGLKRTFFVSPEARVTKKGEPVTLRALHVGDWVSLKLGGTTVVEQVEMPVVVTLRAPEQVPTQAAAPAPAAPKPAAAPAPKPAPAMPAALPKTASPLPSLALLGSGLLALAGGLSLWRRRLV